MKLLGVSSGGPSSVDSYFTATTISTKVTELLSPPAVGYAPEGNTSARNGASMTGMGGKIKLPTEAILVKPNRGTRMGQRGLVMEHTVDVVNSGVKSGTMTVGSEKARINCFSDFQKRLDRVSRQGQFCENRGEKLEWRKMKHTNQSDHHVSFPFPSPDLLFFPTITKMEPNYEIVFHSLEKVLFL